MIKLVSILSALALSALVGCGSDGGGPLGTKDAGKLEIGSDIPYKPFEFGKPPYQGFDVDLTREIGKRIGLEPVFNKTPFDTIFRDLVQGKFDLVVSAVTVTPQRTKAVAFSQPYFQADQSLTVKRGSETKAVSQLSGKTVGVQLGTSGAEYAKDKVKGATLRSFDLIDDAFQALESGQVDAVINDFAVSKVAEQSKPDLVVVQRIPTNEVYAMAFPKKNEALRAKVNEAITGIKRDGTYTRIYRKWFDSNPPAQILDTTS